MQKLIIEVRVNEYAMRAGNRNVPWTAEEIGRDARAIKMREHLARRFAGAKASHLRGAGDLAVSLLELRRDFTDAHLDVELHQNRAQP